jgi:hypothetical protein
MNHSRIKVIKGYTDYLRTVREKYLKEEKGLLEKVRDVKEQLNKIEEMLEGTNDGKVPMEKLELVEMRDELEDLVATNFTNGMKKRKRPSYKAGHEENTEYREKLQKRKKREEQQRQQMMEEISDDEQEEVITEENNMDVMVQEESIVQEEEKVTIDRLVKKYTAALKMTKVIMKKGQEETEKWYDYALEFRKRLKEEMEGFQSDQLARKRIYEQMEEKMNGATKDSIRMKTKKAEKILELFITGGRSKIKKLKITSVNTLSKMTHGEMLKRRQQIFNK